MLTKCLAMPNTFEIENSRPNFEHHELLSKT